MKNVPLSHVVLWTSGVVVGACIASFVLAGRVNDAVERCREAEAVALEAAHAAFDAAGWDKIEDPNGRR